MRGHLSSAGMLLLIAATLAMWAGELVLSGALTGIAIGLAVRLLAAHPTHTNDRGDS